MKFFSFDAHANSELGIKNYELKYYAKLTNSTPEMDCIYIVSLPSHRYIYI